MTRYYVTISFTAFNANTKESISRRHEDCSCATSLNNAIAGAMLRVMRIINGYGKEWELCGFDVISAN